MMLVVRGAGEGRRHRKQQGLRQDNEAGVTWPGIRVVAGVPCTSLCFRLVHSLSHFVLPLDCSSPRTSQENP